MRGRQGNSTETGDVQVSRGPLSKQVVLIRWHRDRGRPVGKMIPYGDRAGVDGWGGGLEVCCLLGRTSYSRRRGRRRFIFKIRNNKLKSLVP